MELTRRARQHLLTFLLTFLFTFLRAFLLTFLCTFFRMLLRAAATICAASAVCWGCGEAERDVRCSVPYAAVHGVGRW